MADRPARDYATTYRGMTDDELERVLRDFDDLLDEAKPYLLAELKARGRDDRGVSLEIEAAQKQRIPLISVAGADLELTSRVGSIRRVRRTGWKFYGKANCLHDETFDYDEFDATRWWTQLGVPVFPAGSFRIRQRTPEDPEFVRLTRDDSIVVVRSLPFIWSQNARPLALALAFWLPFAFILLVLWLGGTGQ